MKEEIRVTVWSFLAEGIMCLVLVSAALTLLTLVAYGPRSGTEEIWYNLWFVSRNYVVLLALWRLRLMRRIYHWGGQ